jgi:hypothetical protein
MFGKTINKRTFTFGQVTTSKGLVVRYDRSVTSTSLHLVGAMASEPDETAHTVSVELAYRFR